jgi:hypothetical protein
MVPAAPPPSRTPQLVALAVVLLIGIGGVVVWWQLRTDMSAPEPAAGLVSTRPTVPAPPAVTTPTADKPASTVETTAASTVSTVGQAAAVQSTVPAASAVEWAFPRGKLKGPMPKGKGKTPAGAPEPTATAKPAQPSPDLPKPPDDMANPYREHQDP